MTTVLYLVRHGLTESNLAGRYMGRSEEPLAGDGRWQARQLARRLRGVDFSACYSSPMQRARETAEIVAAPHRLKVEIEPLLMELELERWAGQTADEIRAREPQEWRQWCEDPTEMSLPGIEPFAEAAQRVRRAVDAIRRRHPDETVAAVTHDGIVRIAVLQVLGMGLQHYRSMPIDNTALTVLELTGGRPYLRALNDTGHLAEAGMTIAAGRGPGDR